MLAEALVREMKEETSLDVEPVRLLYVRDHLPADVVHMTFEARRTGGVMGDIAAGFPGAGSYMGPKSAIGL
jgi:8-oxo-dGTP pyrophosphatase MutT (NUDIX family)